MVVEKGVSEEKGRERCILVGFQIDVNGRELLSWALTNIAKEGDRVMALNISRNNQDINRTPTLSLIKILDDFMAEHVDLCTQKKVILAVRIARGNSFRRVLVKEAEFCAARTVVVGASNNYSFGCPASLAKYCVKKLPSTISVIAVHKGEVIFQRASTNVEPISGRHEKLNLRSVLHPSIGLNPKLISPSSTRKLSDEGKEDVREMTKESKDFSLIVHDKTRESSISSISVLERKLPEQKPGWPLLHKAVTANIEALKDGEEMKMSVIQWVMKLPDRSLTSTRPHVNLVKELERILGLNSSTCKFFPYEELQISTNYFSQENLIGKGGNSKVYIGCLSNGQQVAVKVSKSYENSSRDFLLEVDIITRLQQERVVPLIGICVYDNNPISIYSYFSRGSLEENLHGKRANAPLDWGMRFKVAVGVAEALSYLHDGCSSPVIHRDVKSSNILLSDECKPMLSDFGLAVWAPTTSPYQTHSDVVGTFGYLAPEYFMYGKVSIMVDVYAFGVVLLELLTGRKPINDESPKGHESLVMWATPILERGNVMELLDPNLYGKYEVDQMKRMVCAASLCIRRAARCRPQMNQILELLRGEEEIEPWMSSNLKNNVTEQDCQDEETYQASSFESHIGLALLDVDDDASVMSFEQNSLNSLDEYLPR